MQLNEIMRKPGPRLATTKRVVNAVSDYIVEKFLSDARKSFEESEGMVRTAFLGTTEEEWIRYGLHEPKDLSHSMVDVQKRALQKAWESITKRYPPLTREERRDLTDSKYHDVWSL